MALPLPRGVEIGQRIVVCGSRRIAPIGPPTVAGDLSRV